MNNDWREYSCYDLDYLAHHGILGQKWGVRRFENAAGRLTAAGKNRYNQVNGAYQKLKKKVTPNKVESTGKKTEGQSEEPKKKGLSDKQKKMIVAGAAVAGTALAAYGGYKLYQLNKKTTEGMADRDNQKATSLMKDSYKMGKLASEQANQADWFKTHAGAHKAMGDNSTYNAYKDAHAQGMANANATRKEAANLANQAGQLANRAKAKNYSLKEKADYLKDQKNSNLSGMAAVTKARQQYAKEKMAWNRKTIKLESQKAMAERYGDTKTAAKIDNKLASSPPPIPPTHSKAGVAATNKLASEASALARSVTAAGPKSFSKPAQNVSKSTSTTSKASTAYNSGKKTVSNITKISGQQKFNQAAKANDDYVSQMLKRNGSSLSNFSMKDLSKLDLY